MKNLKKLTGILLTFAIAFATVFATGLSVYAQNDDIDYEDVELLEDDEDFDDEEYDEEEYDEEDDAEEDETEKKLYLSCNQSSYESFEYVTTDFSKKDKKITNFYDSYVENEDYESVEAKLSYKVTKTDKYLAFSKNTLTIKKGIKAGTHKIKVQVTASVAGYEDVSETLDITVKIKKPRTSGTTSGIAYCDIGNTWDLPIDVAGTYKVTISGPGAKKLDVKLMTNGRAGKTIKSGSKVKLNPKKQAFYIVPKKIADESYKITIKVTKA